MESSPIWNTWKYDTFDAVAGKYDLQTMFLMIFKCLGHFYRYSGAPRETTSGLPWKQIYVFSLSGKPVDFWRSTPVKKSVYFKACTWKWTLSTIMFEHLSEDAYMGPDV